MPNGDEHCHAHSGVCKQVASLEERTTKLENRMDTIMNRLNSILGGIVVACALLVINIVIETV